MNFCSRCRALLGEFLDGTLSTSEREKVAAHLETCSACAEEKREIEWTRAILSELTPQPAPENLRLRVRNTLQNEAAARQLQGEKGRIWIGLPRFAWTGTATLAAFALLLLAQPFSQNPRVDAPLSEDAEPPSKGPTEILPPVVKTAPKTRKTVAPGKSPLTQNPAPKRRETAPKTGSSSAVVPERSNLPAPLPPARREVQPRRNVVDAPVSSAAPKIVETRPNLSKAPPAVLVTPPLAIQPKVVAPSAASLPRTMMRPPAAITPSEAPTFAMTVSPLQNQATQSLARTFGADRREKTAEQKLEDAPNAALSPSLPAPASAAPKMSARQAKSSVEARSPEISRDFRDNAPRSTVNGAEPLQEGTRARRSANAPTAPDKTNNEAAADSEALSLRADSISERFEVKIQASRGVANAQIRVTLPEPLRFTTPGAPTSRVVWSGDLAVQKPVSIELEVQNARGGEKIEISVEQKGDSTRSNVIETRTLQLPMLAR